MAKQLGKMMQLDLFSTGIICDHCKQDPGRNPNNPNLWNGFLDKDTGEHVCYSCGKLVIKATSALMGLHYAKKKRKFSPGADQGLTFSEFPVMIK